MRKELIVNTSELANILGITRQRVNQLAKEKIIPKVKVGKFDLFEVVPAIISYEIEKAKKPLNEKIQRLSDKDPFRRLTAIKAEREEINLKKEMEEIVKVDDVINYNVKRDKELMKKLDNLPVRVSKKLDGVTKTDAQDILITEIIKIKYEFATTNIEFTKPDNISAEPKKSRGRKKKAVATKKTTKRK